MIITIKEKLLKRKLINALEKLAETFIKNLYLVSTVKKEIKEVKEKNQDVYAIKLTGKTRISEDIIDSMIIILNIYKVKGKEIPKYDIKIIDNLKFNEKKFTEEQINEIYSVYEQKILKKFKLI